jgi:hypothetical protein
VAASENSILQRRTGTLTIAGQTVFVGQNTPLFAAVSLQSAPGDIIGQGVNRNYTLQEASIDAVNNTTTFGSMLITLRTPDGTWRLRLEAPAGTSLAPGDYNNAGKPPALPGLDFSRDSTTCSQISGRFRLGEVVYSPIDRFYRVNIVFEQRCNGSTSALVGNIWISSDGTTTPPPLALPGAAANIRR